MAAFFFFVSFGIPGGNFCYLIYALMTLDNVIAGCSGLLPVVVYVFDTLATAIQMDILA